MGEGAGMNARVTLSPPLRRAVAELHARQTFQQHMAEHYPSATCEQLAEYLTVLRVPPVRGSGPWDGMRVHNLLKRVQRSAKSGATY